MRTMALGALAASAAWGQCSMCRTAAAAQGAAAAKTFDYAVLILLIPAVGLFCGISASIFRSQKPHD